MGSTRRRIRGDPPSPQPPPRGRPAHCDGRGARDFDVLVSGYASIDVVYQACSSPQVGATSLLHGPAVSKPRCGGCGPGAAAALARAGCRVGLLTWLGDDREGQACLQDWIDVGIDRAGVEVAAGQASPRCFLFYDPGGGATCYYHPSGSAGLRLTAGGRELLAKSGALAVTVGPPGLTEALLAERRPEQRLAWNVKADAHAFPPALRGRLARESGVICLNRDELAFVASIFPDVAALTPLSPSPTAVGEGGKALLPAHRLTGGGIVSPGADPHPNPSPTAMGEGLVTPNLERNPAIPPPVSAHRERGWGEGLSPQDTLLQEQADTELIATIQRYSGGIVVVTAGAAGCHVAWPGGAADVPAVPVQVADPTGAGDAFFGTLVAGWLRGANAVEAASAAAEYVAAVLRERAAGEAES